MEEKERYSLFIGQCCVDKEDKNKLINGLDRLNQQDKRIKELESKLRVSNSLNASLSLEHSELKKRHDSQEELLTRKLAENSRLILENQQLKEQLEDAEALKINAVQDKEVADIVIAEYKKQIEELKQSKVVINEYDNATEEKCLDDLNYLTDDLSWQYQLDDLDKLISKAKGIENIAKRLKELKENKDENI